VINRGSRLNLIGPAMSVAVFKLDGLPFRMSVEAVGKFFSEVDVTPVRMTTFFLVLCELKRISLFQGEIHLLVNRDLRPSGVGFITVNDENDIKPVLQMDGKTVGDMKRYVKVSKY
jgi:hypothetical protein